MKQPKELYLKEQWLIHTYKNVDSDANENIKKLIRQIALDDWKFIKSLLTQQRTELLEEIKKEIIKITDNGYDCVCSSYIEDYFKSLLNKKDE